MGVAGAGKTTVGKALAQHLHCEFADADDWHSPESISKMKAGQPLTDSDREPWLAALHRSILGWQDRDYVVLACSALKRAYREQLAEGVQDLQALRFVFLDISSEAAAARLHHRSGHYASKSLMQSQFETLERPSGTEAVIVNAALPVDVLVEQIVSTLPS